MKTTTRILSASVLALSLPWMAVSVAEAEPKLDLGQFERCLAKPRILKADGVHESTYEQRKRCCAAAGGTLVISTQGPPNCVKVDPRAPRAVIDVPSLGVLTPA